MQQEFKNKTVMVTGAGRGLGKRLALGFGRLGARVAIVSRSRQDLHLTRIEIEHLGGNALPIEADVTDAERMRTAVERARVEFQAPLQALICAAGILGPVRPFTETNPTQWLEAVHVNLLGTANACRAVLPEMLAKRSGKIVVLTCDTDRPPHANLSAYSVSKSAVVRLVESIAVEVAPRNVQINCLDPGRANTAATDELIASVQYLDEELAAEVRETRRTGGAPAELQMQFASFLASEQSNHITGKLIHITDDWQKLKNATLRPDALTLRRVTK